jgi:phosphoglycerate dehydrogenase-like enzyme
VLNVEGNFLPNVDYTVCFERGIELLCAAPVFGQPVAELALGLALACARDIPRADRELRDGSESLYDDGRNENAFLLAGKTLGLVGCGNLGRALLPLLRPFGGQLLVHDPWLAADELRALAVEPVGLVELFTRSRVVFVVSTVTTDNVGAIGPTCFDAMAPGGVVVLASRAAVVDWEAMLDAAASGRIRIATDVFPEEPIPPDERARRTKGTVLSAHRGGNVPEIWQVMGEMVADDLEAIVACRAHRRLQVADPARVGMLRSRPIG